MSYPRVNEKSKVSNSKEDPDVLPEQRSDERTIASYDTVKKTEIPLQVDAPRNEGFESSFDEFAGAFPNPHTEFFAHRGADYDAYRKAFEFGARLASDPQFAEQSWVVAENGIRSEWAEKGGNNGTDWDTAVLAIRAGWEDARGTG